MFMEGPYTLTIQDNFRSVRAGTEFIQTKGPQYSNLKFTVQKN